MKNYVNYIKNHRKAFFILLILINITAIVGVFQIKINSNFNIFMPEKSIYKDRLEQMKDSFPSSEQILFLVKHDKTDISPEVIKDYNNFQRFLEKIKNIKLVNGPAPEKIQAGMQQINISEVNQQNIKTVKNYYQNLGELSPITQKDNKLYGSFTIYPKENLSNKQLHKIENYLSNNNLSYSATGNIYLQQKIIDYILLILLFLPPTAIILILTIFKTQMGSLKATFLSVIPAGIAALWTMGLVGWIGESVSIITVLAPIFTIVIGSADGLHFISHVQEARSEGKDRIESIVETLKMVGTPMIITTVTSIVGFLSLLIMNTNAIFDLAFFASIGIFLAGVATWYILPLILTGETKLTKPETRRKILTGKVKKLWGKPAIIILALLIILSLFGAQNVKTEFNQLMIYRDYTEVHQSFEKIRNITGGSIPVYINIKSEDNPLKPAYGKKILDFENKLKNTQYVNKSISIYNFFANMYSSFMGLEQKQYPNQMMRINMINSKMKNKDNYPASLLFNRKENKARLMVFPVDLKNNTLAQIEQMTTNFNQNNKNFEAKITGVPYLMKDLNQSMISNQTKTLILAFALVFLLLYISLKSIKPAVISILPIAFTVLILYGFLGLSGISLNLFTTTIFSITIGVGIDYAVHFTSVWRNFKNKGFNSDDAVQKAYVYTSRPIMANALGLAVGLSALLFSPLQIHLYVSTLMWISMICGVFLSLSFLPSILQKIK